MQFLPATWSVVGVDADGDFARSPDDIDDAALAAAVFLCSAPGSLSTESGRRTAVLRYNPSSSYVASVLAIERSYRAGDFDTAGEPVQADSVEILATRYPDATTGVPTGSAQPDAGKVAGAGRVPDHGDDPATDPSGPRTPTRRSLRTPTRRSPRTPTRTRPTPDPPTRRTRRSRRRPPIPPRPPTPTLSPTPSLTPEPDPGPVQLTGVLTACVSGWCLGELPLDVGNSDFLASASSSDFDADGVVESTTEELTGLAGTEVSLLVAPDTAPALVLALNGVTYALG